MGRDHVHLCFAGGVSAGTDGGNHLAGEIKYRGADTHGAVNKFADGDTDVLPANFFNLLSEGFRIGGSVIGVARKSLADILLNIGIALKGEKHLPAGSAVEIAVGLKAGHDLDAAWSLGSGNDLAVKAGNFHEKGVIQGSLGDPF